MAQVSHNNGSASPVNGEAASMVARARTLMIISGLTTLIAIAAVISVIGYRVANTGNSGPVGIDGVIALPKGARVVSTAASAGRIAVLIDIGGRTELRTFDIKTMRQTGRVEFTTEP
jgi:hypothetical protein